jgi:hypothetical protein
MEDAVAAHLKDLSAEENVTASQLVRVAVLRLVKDIEAGEEIDYDLHLSARV